MRRLSELLADTTILRAGGDSDILAIPVEPRQLAQRELFFKLRSRHVRISAKDAIRQGARYVVLEAGDDEEATLPPDIPYLVVDDVNRAFARSCARIFDDAHRQLTLIGVTGAKGKTTVCHLIDAGLRATGIRTGLMSSLVFRLPESQRPAAISIPDALSLHGFLAALLRMGGTHAILEIPLASIAEERLFGLQFGALVFTNAGMADSDVLDVNRRLFTDPQFHRSSSTIAVFNADDPASSDLAGASPGRVVTFGLGPADVTPERHSPDCAGTSMRLYGRDLRFSLIGRPNTMNILAAAAVVRGITQTDEGVLQLQTVAPLPGRMERLSSSATVDVYLDQAYTPTDVALSLAAVREIAGRRRVICIVSSGGGSESRHRALRARAAASACDFCFLTAEDPGEEHPASIVMDMVKGLTPAMTGRVRTIIDRSTAIVAAIHEALPDGIVVILGKRVTGIELRNGDSQLATKTLREVAT